MNQTTARQLVLVSLLLTGGVVTYDVLKHRDTLGPDQSFRAVWSLALLFLLLAILSDVVPELAGPFAAITCLAVLMGRQGALSAIISVGKPKTRTGGGPGQRPN